MEKLTKISPETVIFYIINHVYITFFIARRHILPHYYIIIIFHTSLLYRCTSDRETERRENILTNSSRPGEKNSHFLPKF